MNTIDPFLFIAEKVYRLLPHAIDQMMSRKITRKMVGGIIHRGIHFKDPTRSSTCMEFNGMRVVADLNCSPAQIISVMYTRTSFRESY